jgi:hypothetical protein
MASHYSGANFASGGGGFNNVPFRLIFAYNPNASPDITDPRVLSLERRRVVRFSIGRMF